MTSICLMQCLASSETWSQLGPVKVYCPFLTRLRMAFSVGPPKGGYPTSKMYMMTPALQMSQLHWWPDFPKTCGMHTIPLHSMVFKLLRLPLSTAAANARSQDRIVYGYSMNCEDASNCVHVLQRVQAHTNECGTRAVAQTSTKRLDLQE